jgi:hypothetical protein
MVPHGLFFFLVASQVSMILAYMRTADSTALDSRLREALQTFEVKDVAAAERTFVNEFEWFSATDTEFSRKQSGILAKLFYRITASLTALTGLAFYVFPSGAGIYTLTNHNTMITLGNVSLQYWVIFVTTLLSILWFISFLAVWAAVRK